MKVAVTSQGVDMNSTVDPRFGRAKFFVLIDTETGEFITHNNAQNLNAVQGAGIRAAENVVSLGVAEVITGSVAPRTFAVLQADDVQAYVGAIRSVHDVGKHLKDGRSEHADKADVEGHGHRSTI